MGERVTHFTVTPHSFTLSLTNPPTLASIPHVTCRSLIIPSHLTLIYNPPPPYQWFTLSPPHPLTWAAPGAGETGAQVVAVIRERPHGTL